MRQDFHGGDWRYASMVAGTGHGDSALPDFKVGAIGFRLVSAGTTADYSGSSWDESTPAARDVASCWDFPHYRNESLGFRLVWERE